MAIKFVLVEIVLVETVLVGDPLYVQCSNLQMINNRGKQTKVLTNKFGFFARILVCLSEFWFVCQTSNY